MLFVDCPKVVIIGNDYSSAVVFYSLQAYLLKSRQPFDVLLVSDSSYYYFNSLLGQLLLGACDLNDLCQEFRKVGLLRPGISCLEAKVKNIDFNKNIVKTSKNTIHYDYLVLAPVYDLQESELINNNQTFTISFPEDIINIRNHLLRRLETASCETSTLKKKELLTISIIGADKSGIEVAFSIYDYMTTLIKKQFPEINKNLLQINLIDEKSVISNNEDPFYNNLLFSNLNKKGIKLFTGSKLTSIESDKVVVNVNDERELISGTIISLNGLNGRKSSSLITLLNLEGTDSAIIPVDIYSQIKGIQNVFVIGECTKCLDLREDLHQTDFYYKEQAKICAYNVLSKINNNPLKPLQYNKSLDFLSLGARSAIAGVKGFYFDGFLGWLFYRLIYIWCFLGIRKKIITLISLLLDILDLKENALFPTRDQRVEVREHRAGIKSKG